MNDDTKLRELSAEKACEILEGIKFKTVADEIEAVNAVSAYIRTSVEEIERLKAENEHNIKRALEIAGERDAALAKVKELESELKFEIDVANAQTKIATEGQQIIQELEAELERKDEALIECICTLQWHLNKSKPYEDADQSDFFNLTANSIIKGEEAINLTKK
jgi:regulator of replication initiation timing